jgi:hypothetical protein
MTAAPATESLNNFLFDFTDEDALKILALSSAANDLATCHKVLSSLPKLEQTYFFALSLSIVRELAKVISDVSKSFNRSASLDTQKILEDLSSKLTPFDDESLAKKVLKPLRDVTFHYDYRKLSKNSNKHIAVAVAEIKRKESLSVSFDSSKSGLLKNRYIFADEFREILIGQWLTTDLVAQLAAIAVSVLELVDSLLNDLSRKTNSRTGVQ